MSAHFCQIGKINVNTKDVMPVLVIYGYGSPSEVFMLNIRLCRKRMYDIRCTEVWFLIFVRL